jgi:hypothetical protein
VGWGGPGLVQPPNRLKRAQAELKLDDAGIVGPRIILFEQVSSRGWG